MSSVVLGPDLTPTTRCLASGKRTTRRSHPSLHESKRPCGCARIFAPRTSLWRSWMKSCRAWYSLEPSLRRTARLWTPCCSRTSWTRPPSSTLSRTMKSTVLRPPLRPHRLQHCAHRPPAPHTPPTRNATSVAISTTPWPSASSSRRPGSSPSSRAQSAPISAQIRPQVLRTTRNPAVQTASPQPQRSLQEAQVFPLALRTSFHRSSSMLTSPGLQTQGPLLI